MFAGYLVRISFSSLKFTSSLVGLDDISAVCLLFIFDDGMMVHVTKVIEVMVHLCLCIMVYSIERSLE